MMKINVKGTIIPNDDQWIYDLFDIDATSPAKVSKGITAAAEKGEPLDVYINSGGGDIFVQASHIYRRRHRLWCITYHQRQEVIIMTWTRCQRFCKKPMKLLQMPI